MNKITYLLISVLIVFALGGNIDLHFLLDVKVDAEFTPTLVNIEFPIEFTMIFPALCKKSKNDSSQK